MELILIPLLLIVMYLPTILAFKNDHPRRWLILACNLLIPAAGWFVAWLIYVVGKEPRKIGLPAPVSAHSPLPTCPSCQHPYDPKDYDPRAFTNRCKKCQAPLRIAMRSH